MSDNRVRAEDSLVITIKPNFSANRIVTGCSAGPRRRKLKENHHWPFWMSRKSGASVKVLPS